jgi:hypothetical protein
LKKAMEHLICKETKEILADFGVVVHFSPLKAAVFGVRFIAFPAEPPAFSRAMSARSETPGVASGEPRAHPDDAPIRCPLPLHVLGGP